jgi:murein DD-endopeptidase MepM/ murein hydrolase activator NlpD
MEVFSMGVRNWFKKSSKTFDREGFYIILFICLCIVAVTAVYISRNNSGTAKKSAEGQKVIDQQKEPEDKTDLVQGNTSDLKSVTDNKTVPAVNPPDKSNNTSSVTKTPATVKTDASTTQTFKIAMPVEGKISKDFDKEELQFSQSLNQWETHEGIDILCEIGSEVKAVASGKVVDIISEDNAASGSEKYVFGVTVIIEHSNGMRSVYSNLDNGNEVTLKLKKGDSIKKGQVIGIVGDTTLKENAATEGSHLHFSMLKKSGKEYVTVNPNNYLK